MKAITNLKDLMVEQLRDLYHAEKSLQKTLPTLPDYVNAQELQTIIGAYIEINDEQLMRLRQAFELLFARKRGESCEAMTAMITEMNDLLSRSMEPMVRDAGLVTALQHIIHYKIAGYGAVCTYAQMLDFDEAAAIIHRNLEMEKRTDERLIQLAEGVINQRALVYVE